MTTAPDEIPDAVTHREIRELLGVFGRSDWTGMELEVRGVRVVVGRTGPPPTADRPAQPDRSTQPDPEWRTRSASGTEAPLDHGEPPPPPPPPPPAPAVDRTGLVDVRSPAVGSFWVAPGPGQAAFAPVGTRVEADQQIAIVEVMKLMSPVLAPTAGEVVEACAVDGDLVEYDQPLFRIRPDARA